MMNWIYLASGGEGGGQAGGAFFSLLGLEVTGAVTTMWGIMFLVLLLAWVGTRRLERVPRSRLQGFLEWVVETLVDFYGGITGRERALQLVPLVGAFFIFILLANYSGLLPGAGHVFPWLLAPTSHWSVTAGLAVVVFFTTQYFGIRKKGLGYYKHMVEPLFLSPLLLPLGILEELVRPFSLSLRLYANIFGGEMVVAAMVAAIPYFLPIATLLLELIFGLIQAIIFTVLTSVYLTAALSEEH
ncbi:MAG: F0F1 ATP synthase subunit A [Firmicutes bacterium]|nr:F0F1 ATP synthase subunit A [Bacillota bacterium]MCL5039929.1 F0F1 ATP synthase subunit A [Bacillota bacterium]